MKISSPDFAHMGKIPAKFTCDGDDINPTFMIENIPSNAKSLSLIVDDPDAPAKTWVHWVVFNIPLVATIAEDSIPGAQGFNDFQRNNWGGPCPPSGIHRYFFKLYALDISLSLDEGATKEEVEAAMEGHVIAQTEIIGLYQRK